MKFKNKILGWQEVFSFTLTQAIKGNAIKIFVIILCLLALLSSPIMQVISGLTGSGEDGEIEDNTSIEKVIIIDELGIGMDSWQEGVADYESFADIDYEENEDDIEDLESNLQEDEDMKNTLLMHVTYENGRFSLQFIKGIKTKIDNSDIENLAKLMSKYLEEDKINIIGISSEQAQDVEMTVETKIVYANQEYEENIDDEESGISMVEYYTMLVVIVILTMFITISGEFVASSIITEKSTKVIEYLLINVKPLSLIVGKVLAVLVVSIGEFILIGICFMISKLIGNMIFKDPVTLFQLLNLGSENVTLNLGLVPVSIIVILAGILLYSIIAGLAGATVSRIEDMSEGMKLFSILVVFGAYIGLAAIISNMAGNDLNIFAKFACLFPLSSPFIVPGYLLLGKINIIIALLAFFILIISSVLLFLFVAKVFEVMIYYNGNALKLKDVLMIFKNKDVKMISKNKDVNVSEEKNEFKKTIRIRKDRLNKHMSKRNRKEQYIDDIYIENRNRQKQRRKK